MVSDVRHLQKIPINQLVVPKQNVRSHSIDKGLDVLKASIKSIGLIEPISVYKEQSDQYVVLAGQRRLNAYHELNEEYPNQGFNEIECLLTDSPKDDNMKRAISLGENITHLAMSKEDLKHAVTELYNISGNYKEVKEKFGLTKGIIDKYVGLSRLPEKIKQSIQSGGIHAKQSTAENVSLKAVDALQWTKDGNVSEDKVLELATTLGNKINHEFKNDIVVETKKNPEGNINENVERARNKTHEIIKLRLEPELNAKLEHYSKNEGDTSKADTVIDIISEKLNSESN